MSLERRHYRDAVVVIAALFTSRREDIMLAYILFKSPEDLGKKMLVILHPRAQPWDPVQVFS